MGRLPLITLTTLSTLALSLGCSQAAPPAPETSFDREFFRTPQDSPKPQLETTLEGTAPIEDPVFLKTSILFRKVLQKSRELPPSDAIDLLDRLRAQKAPRDSERQMAAFIEASLVENEAPSQPNYGAILDLYREASRYKPFRSIALLNGSRWALERKDELALRELLSPLVQDTREFYKAKLEYQKTIRSGEKPQRPTPRPSAPQLDKAVYMVAESYFRGGDYEKASEFLRLTRQCFPNSEFAIGSDYYLGVLALEIDHDLKSASNYFRHYLSRSPGGRRSAEIGKALLGLGTGNYQLKLKRSMPADDSTNPQDPLTAPDDQDLKLWTGPVLTLSQQDHRSIAYAFYKHGMWKEALEQWAEAKSNHILRATCLMKMNDKDQAISALVAAVKSNPRDPLIKNVTETLCKPLTRQQALDLWKQILASNTNIEADALWNIGRRIGSTGADYYRILLNKYPKSSHAPEAAWWLMWSEIEKAIKAKGAVSSNHHKAALNIGSTSLRAFPKSDAAPRIAFWCGKMHEKLGQRALAMKAYMVAAREYPGTYYSYRAEQRYLHLNSLSTIQNNASGAKTQAHRKIADRKWETVPGRKTPMPDWNWPEPPQLFTWPAAKKSMGESAATLAWLGLYSEALKNLPGLIKPEEKAWLYLKAGKPMSALGTASYKIMGTPRASKRWELAYPLAYARKVEMESKRWSLDPLLVHGLIRQESRYDPNARSRSNAMGLMQLLKGTAYGVAKHNNIPLASDAQIFAPETNIALGCAYLAYVKRRHENSDMFAVGSYNGGPNAVQKWKKNFIADGIGDLDVFVENIPYKETRNYVRQVFAHYWNYEKLYAK